MITLDSSRNSESDEARKAFCRHERRHFLRSDWMRLLFIHFELDARLFQPDVPFDLDLFRGRAFVSLVAFEMERLELVSLGRLGRLLTRPIARARFLNVRTYVHGPQGPGIYFMREWISSRLSAWLGPFTYGLPYRFGKLEYAHDEHAEELRGRVSAGDESGALSYHATLTQPFPTHCESESLDSFLLERYLAYARAKEIPRYFRIWHEPWLQYSAAVEIGENSLLDSTGPWWKQARRVGAHFAAGTRGVWIGRPRCVRHTEDSKA